MTEKDSTVSTVHQHTIDKITGRAAAHTRSSMFRSPSYFSISLSLSFLFGFLGQRTISLHFALSRVVIGFGGFLTVAEASGNVPKKTTTFLTSHLAQGRSCLCVV